MAKAASGEIELLLEMIDDAFGGKAWHGPNLRGILRGLTAAEASARPAGVRHSIAELVIHCGYWKYAVRRRLRGDKRGSFPFKGSNWFVLPDSLDDKTWRSILKLLDSEHAGLRAAVAEVAPRRLGIRLPGSEVRYRKLIHGIASHDVYHAGQIRLLKAMLARG
ncbi:MAG: DinB family protein [Phycisphaerae bacterium]|nr:DinB family protein [Phycisphaerae bacterium]